MNQLPVSNVVDFMSFKIGINLEDFVLGRISGLDLRYISSKLNFIFFKTSVLVSTI